MYKLTKGALSIIRDSKAGVAEAIKDGFALDGEVVFEGGDYKVINAHPIFDDPKASKVPKKE